MAIMSDALFTPTNAFPELSLPVYSLATLNEDTSTNMNIVTYATAVGIKPRPTWVISLYKGTLSYANFARTGYGALQLMNKKQHKLVDVLGKSSGRDMNKAEELASRGVKLMKVNDVCQELDSLSVMDDCISIAILRRRDIPIVDVGDHDLFFCDIENFVSRKDYNHEDILRKDDLIL
jgi:flavin reductase (DIM6/NTAB) family NADH-FMN oxidoreductase RutF